MNKTNSCLKKIVFKEYYTAFSNASDSFCATDMVSQCGNRVYSANKCVAIENHK